MHMKVPTNIKHAAFSVSLHLHDLLLLQVIYSLTQDYLLMPNM